MTSPNGKVALWLRVSTRDQDSENQRQALRQMATARGWVVAREFDHTVGRWADGLDNHLDELLDGAGRGQFGRVLVWSLDRLSGKGGEATLNLIAQIAQRGVTVVSVQEPWIESMGDPMLRNLLTYLAGWVAEFELRRLRERTRAGLARARAEGKRIGRPKGAKDKKTRRRSGYLLREARKREAKP